jgi:hypothetical protein
VPTHRALSSLSLDDERRRFVDAEMARLLEDEADETVAALASNEVLVHDDVGDEAESTRMPFVAGDHDGRRYGSARGCATDDRAIRKRRWIACSVFVPLRAEVVPGLTQNPGY